MSAPHLGVPEAERPTTVALVGNYGEAGALEHFARWYPLPRVICPHNSVHACRYCMPYEPATPGRGGRSAPSAPRVRCWAGVLG